MPLSISEGSIDATLCMTKELWHFIALGPSGNVIPMPPQNVLLKDEQKVLGGGARNAILNNTAVHAVYYLALDAISHHLIIETNAGLARIHQAFIRAGVGVIDASGIETPQKVLQGYTARKWETPPEHDGSRPRTPFEKAHRRWGMGLDRSRADLEVFLDKVFVLQELSNALAVEMEAQLPPEIVAEENEMAAADAAWVAAGGEPRVRETNPRQVWFDMLKKHPHWATMTLLGDKGAAIQSHPHNFPPDAGWGPFTFRVSNPVFDDFCRVHAEITGCSPSASTFVSILGFGSKWATMGTVHAKTGKFEAVGWAFICSTIPH